ncbi:hypothetical protein Sa4125_44580 [Aureimonas sp. SA4125]|uniref:ATP-binding protein n=1 Tax=Aureimonas sp. SA4125 TaxID=2826993 RepID=UPI001CC4C694|nr:ATP-binding protein [Aureimonas sp. SA4125]BDA86916.1 hypothetical protein Sa4125_44580 [Aureimonas sp. SA4125]
MQQLLRTALQHVPGIIFARNASGRIVYGNDDFLELFAPSTRKKITDPTQEENSIPENLTFFLSDDLHATARNHADMVYSISDWTGRVRRLRVRRRPFELPGETFLLVIATDVVELEAREAELVRAAARLREWASVASHDLRSPIGSYVTAISMIQNDRENVLSAQTQQYLELISASASSVVQQLSAMIVRERGDAQLDAVTLGCDLNLALAEVRAAIAAQLAQSRVVLHAARMPTIAGDRAAFRRVFQALFENCIRRRAEDNSRIVLRYERGASEHCLSVEDNGRVMGTEMQEALCRPFDEGAPVGRVIGLVDCQRAVARDGGRIAVDQQFRGGCRVVVHVPVVSAAGTLFHAAGQRA